MSFTCFEKYIDVFEKCGKPIDHVPILDLGNRIGNRIGHTDYIDFIKPEELSDPIMKFVDVYKRSGIVLRLCAKDKALDIIKDEYDSDIKKYSNTLALFQMYTDKLYFWTYGWGNSDSLISNVYIIDHELNHLSGFDYTFSHSTVPSKFLEKLLSGEDRLFEIA